MSDLIKDKEDIMNRLSGKYNQWVIDMKYKEKDKRDQLAILESPEAQTDKSENHVYQAAKDRLMQLNAEIKTLSDKQDAYRDFASLEYKPTSTISIGSVAKIRLIRDNTVFTICLVPKDLGSAIIGAVCTSSPVGAVILGKKAGDEVVVNTLSGQLTYKIEEVY